MSTGNMRKALGAEVRIHLPWKGNGTTHISASASLRGSFFADSLLLLVLLLPFEEALDLPSVFRVHLPPSLSVGVFPMMGRQQKYSTQLSQALSELSSGEAIQQVSDAGS